MALFDFLKRNVIKSPVEKFEAIKKYTRAKMDFLMDGNLDRLCPKDAAHAAIYRVLNEAIGEKLGEEAMKKLDKAEEAKHVLDMLQEEMGSGRMTETELGTILESQEYKDYIKIVRDLKG